MENEVIQKIENQIKKSSILLKDYATKYDEAIRLVEDEKDLIGDVWNTRKRISIHDWEKYFSNEERLDNGNIKEIKARSI